jgi:Mn2+/Fe2+ NRAMP family transporter
MNRIDFKNLKNVVGPGIIMAGAAIGVSHLIQSTRAGADYGFSLWWVWVLACLTKYPFLEFGPRYTAATGENLLLGYKKIGKGALPVFTLLTVLTMFIILASLTLVTAGLAEHLFHLNISMWSWSLIILMICVALTLIGNYPAIDRIMKIIMVILLVFTFAAVLFVFGTPAPAKALAHTPPSYLTPAGIAFIIAFMGWMPIPLDASVWQSIWAKEKFKQTGYQPTVREALFDYKLGFYSAGVVAVFFFLLGVLSCLGSGIISCGQRCFLGRTR